MAAELRKTSPDSVPGSISSVPKTPLRWRLFLLVWAVAVDSAGATTHWVVTEDGKIQQQVDSPLNLKHPHDVVIFMRQEARVNYLKKLEKQLVAQKIHIEENEDRDTGLEQRHYKEDADCVLAKVPLGDLDLYDGTYISLESKHISPEDYVDSRSALPPDLQTPDCTKAFELPYSIYAFQHLRGVQERANLTSPLLSKDDPIFHALSKRLGRGIDEVGHRIHLALQRNSSSWVLYNMASFFWRIKNEPQRAVDCVVRALHFSPRVHKDVALVNMANILHRAHYSADAAILAHAALDLTSDLFTSHYTLGNIYAMLGEYNHSVLCYEQALQNLPFEPAFRRKHAVLCQQRLEQRLEAQHRSLQRTLNELKEYQKQHDHYLRQQEALDKHKLLQEEQILRNIIHETQMAKEAQLGNHQMCRLGQQQRSLHCPFDLPVRYHRGDLFEHVHFVQFGEEVSVASSVALVSEHNLNQSSPSPWLHRSVTKEQDPAAALWGSYPHAQDLQKTLWPQRSDCATKYPVVPAAGELPTFYIPPETHGLSPVASVLYEAGPPQTSAVPDCGPVFQPYPAPLPASLDWPLEGTQLPDPYAAQILQLRSGGWTLEQVGNRIAEALKESPVPRWLLLNEAALFWRAKGNGSRALQCLRKALSSAPPAHRSLGLTNAANLLLHHGLASNANTLLEQSLALNASEPHSLLSMVVVHVAQGNTTGALELFRSALDVALSSSGSSFSSFSSCGQCVSSLPLLRCLQFYPFLYNLSQRPPCSQGGVCLAEEDLGIHLEEWESSEERPDAQTAADQEDSLLYQKVIMDSNGSEEVGAQQQQQQQPAPGLGAVGGVSEGEEEWQLKEELMGAFEGALDVGGKRSDLRGIRVLKNERVAGSRASGGPCFGNCEDDEGAEWITFQVKRVKKARAEGADGLGGFDEGLTSEALSGGQSVLEISGPTIPSPGPSGRWRDYHSLGWPGPEECQRTRRVDLTTVASTWLAVSAKNIDITEHIDFATPLQEPAAEPLCNANLAASMNTLDHLGGVANRAAIHYTGESQLREVLQNLGKEKFPPQSFEQVGTRIAKVLEKNQTSWVLSSMAALYWRVKGQGKRAIDCLRQALNYAPHNMKDVPLISLANIFQNARLWEDALTVARMAVEIAPHFVVNHFTLANVYIAMEEFEKAMRWYESTLKLQPEFAPAKDRLRTIQCYLLTKRERRQP
ncbi:tetratricopeptide repeat protein 17 [Eucyclogobius newberryi]|uniref:tetratricopeptide repeat protein 17 n=1 Tax=Eucyclogobius newberryi TaxID=166745 RepID=UPI003B5BD962